MDTADRKRVVVSARDQKTVSYRDQEVAPTG
jgi:hypothetical protein